MQHLTLTDRHIWTSILAIDGIGQRTFLRIRSKLQQKHKTWGEFWFEQNRFLWTECGLSIEQQEALVVFQKQYTPEDYFGLLQERGIDIIVDTDKIYPELLKNIDDKPILLFSMSASERWNDLPIAVVGTRKVTGYGWQATESITTQLVAEGASIISGFMYGVDAIAHQCAISNSGYTVGVLGYGFDFVYPRENKKLFQEVLVAGGSFITEYAPHVPPSKGTFPVRNRIIAGMSHATVVVEAALKSGSHHTAKKALDYGRTLCAVPGPITNPFSQGTKTLINDGAALVTSGVEVMQQIEAQLHGWFEPPLKKQLTLPFTNEKPVRVRVPAKVPIKARVKKIPRLADAFQQQTYELLSGVSRTTDQLSAQLGQPLPMIQSALCQLELAGLIVRHGANWRIV